MNTSPRWGGARTLARDTRNLGRSAGVLSIGLAISGLMTYLFFALASQNLAKGDYGQIVVLWAAVFVSVSTLLRPIEQVLSRTLAHHDAHGEALLGPIRTSARLQGVVALCFALLAIALRGPLEEGLLDGSSALYWILVGSIVAYAGNYFLRGYLAGTRNFALYSALLIGEAGIRLAFPVALAIGILDGHELVALGVLAGPLAALTAIGIWLGLRRRGGRIGSPVPGGEPVDPTFEPGTDPASAQVPEFTLARGGGFAAAVLVMMLAEQTFLNAGPLVVSASVSSAAAGFIFNILMVARAPLLLFQAVATSLLPHLTRLGTRQSDGHDEAFGTSVRVTLWLIGAFGAALVGILLVAGPELMQIAFGDKFEYERLSLVLVGGATAVYLAAVTLTQAALAHGHFRGAAIAWGASAAGYVAWTIAGPLDHSPRIEAGFLIAAAALVLSLVIIRRRPEPQP